MTSQNTNQPQRSTYVIGEFGHAPMLGMYEPNDEERAARAARDRSEANKAQAEADQINHGLGWSRWKLRVHHALLSLVECGVGFILGLFFQR